MDEASNDEVLSKLELLQTMAKADRATSNFLVEWEKERQAEIVRQEALRQEIEEERLRAEKEAKEARERELIALGNEYAEMLRTDLATNLNDPNFETTLSNLERLEQVLLNRDYASLETIVLPFESRMRLPEETLRADEKRKSEEKLRVEVVGDHSSEMTYEELRQLMIEIDSRYDVNQIAQASRIIEAAWISDTCNWPLNKDYIDQQINYWGIQSFLANRQYTTVVHQIIMGELTASTEMPSNLLEIDEGDVFGALMGQAMLSDPDALCAMMEMGFLSDINLAKYYLR
jgi:hypothetical protein